MREYVEAMRTTWDMHTGRSGDAYEGELYHVRHPGVTGVGYARGTELPDPPGGDAGEDSGTASPAAGSLPGTSDKRLLDGSSPTLRA